MGRTSLTPDESSQATAEALVDIAESLASIAASLEKIANPPIEVKADLKPPVPAGTPGLPPVESPRIADDEMLNSCEMSMNEPSHLHGPHSWIQGHGRKCWCPGRKALRCPSGSGRKHRPHAWETVAQDYYCNGDD